MLLSINAFIFVTLLIVNLLAAAQAQKSSKQGPSKWVADYPNVKRIPKKWTFKSTNGNVGYTEDYYWMENANETDKDLQKFIIDQSALTESYMRQCKDRDAILQSLQDANNYGYVGTLGLFREDSDPIYVYSYTGPTDQLGLWYISSFKEFQAAKKANFNPPPGKLYLNESLLSADQSTSIVQTSPSPDGKIFAYLTTDRSSNSNLGTWNFRLLDSPLVSAKTTPKGGEGSLPLSIPFSMNYLQWLNDSSGFFYTQGQDDQGGTILDHGQKIRFHKWDTDSGQDITVFDAHNLGIDSNSTYLNPYITDDGRWLFVQSYQDLSGKMRTYATFVPGQTISENMKWIVLSPDNEFTMFPITVVDDWYYFQTDLNAENGKVVKIHLDPSKAKTVKLFNELQDRPKIVDVVKERKDASFSATSTSVFPFAHDKAIFIYRENGHNALYLYDLPSGKQLQKVLPTELFSDGYISAYGQSKYAYLTFSSFDTPEKVYEINFENDHVDVSAVSVQYIAGTTPRDFEVQQLYATSKDGTQIPYFVASRKGTPKPSPVWMHAFGAYGYVYNLYFDPGLFTFLNRYDANVVFCSARGGGEGGGAWHHAAQRTHKQTTMDDIHACATDLVKRQITSEGQIILESDSSGAMAMGAVINQASPGLIGAALLERAVLDAFQILLRTSIGQNNFVEYGNPNNASEVASILDWSPLQNIDPHKPYPTILLTPGSDDSVVPSSLSYKYLAQMQYSHPNSSSPFLLYVPQNNGQALPSSTIASGTLEEVYQTCFLELALGLKLRKV